MSFPKQKFREMILQCLYALQLYQDNSSSMTSLLMKELKASKKNVLLAQEKSLTIIEDIKELDLIIDNISQLFRIENMQLVDLNILRLATYEMINEKDIPGKIIIAEGMRLANKFSSKESVAFINALLDSLFKKYRETEKLEENASSPVSSEESVKPLEVDDSEIQDITYPQA